MYFMGEIILKMVKVNVSERVYTAVLVSTIIFSILYFLIFILIMQSQHINFNLKIIVITLIVLLICKKEIKLNLINSKIKLKMNSEQITQLISCIPAVVLIYLNSRIYDIDFVNYSSTQKYHLDLVRFEALSSSLMQTGPFGNHLVFDGQVKYHWFAMYLGGFIEETLNLRDFTSLTRFLPLLSLLSGIEVFAQILKKIGIRKSRIWLFNLAITIGSPIIIGRIGSINIESISQTLAFPLFGFLVLILVQSSSQKKKIYFLYFTLISAILTITKTSYVPFILMGNLLIYRIRIRNKLSENISAIAYNIFLFLIIATIFYSYIYGNKTSDLQFRRSYDFTEYLTLLPNFLELNKTASYAILITILVVNFIFLGIDIPNLNINTKILQKYTQFCFTIFLIVVIFFRTSLTNVLWFAHGPFILYMMFHIAVMYSIVDNNKKYYFNSKFILGFVIVLGYLTSKLLFFSPELFRNGTSDLLKSTIPSRQNSSWNKIDIRTSTELKSKFNRYIFTSNVEDPTYIVALTENQVVFTNLDPLMNFSTINQTQQNLNCKKVIKKIKDTNLPFIYWEDARFKNKLIPCHLQKRFISEFGGGQIKIYQFFEY